MCWFEDSSDPGAGSPWERGGKFECSVYIQAKEKRERNQISGPDITGCCG